MEKLSLEELKQKMDFALELYFSAHEMGDAVSMMYAEEQIRRLQDRIAK